MDTPNNQNNNEPVVPAPTTPEAKSPEDFVREELNQAQLALKRTIQIGIIVFAALTLETIVVATRFAYALQPKQAAIIASGFVQDQLDTHADDLRAAVKERIPAMIQQLPDYAIQQLPDYRQALEAKVNASLATYTHQTADNLGARLDDYLATNKSQIEAVLDNPKDAADAVALGPGLRSELQQYLSEKPTSGESITDQINTSLGMLKDVKSKMDHLANDANLTQTDKLTRHAVAVLAASVAKENLQPIPIKDAIPPPAVVEAAH